MNIKLKGVIMKAHWSDVIKCWSVFRTPNRYERAYEKALGKVVLLTYNSKLSARANLDKLEIGQGYLRNKVGDFGVRSFIYPKKFLTYNQQRLIVRVM
jgi:hypothetical protein